MSADGVVWRTAEAQALAVWLWDPPRRRALWANAAALSLCGAATAAALPPAACDAIAGALARLDGGGTASATIGAGAGSLAATPAALPDGRLGRRVEFRFSTAGDPTHVKAAAFDALPAPAAVIDAAGTIVAANRAFAARHGREARQAAAGFVETPIEDPAPGAALRLLSAAAPGAAGGVVSTAALARIAHEFRSPLTAVLGFAEFLREHADGASPERVRGYLDDLATAAERVRRLADDIVAIGAAGERLSIDVVALDETAEAALRLAAPSAAARGVVLEPFAPSGLSALADPSALGRAVLNLIDNAVRHAGAGARVAVRIEPSGEGVAVIVADDGAGLDPTALEEALRPFGRPGGDRGGEAGGLGLPIAREIAEAHGGTLAVETAPGRGFVATIRLPAACAVRRRPPPRR